MTNAKAAIVTRFALRMLAVRIGNHRELICESKSLYPEIAEITLPLSSDLSVDDIESELKDSIDILVILLSTKNLIHELPLKGEAVYRSTYDGISMRGTEDGGSVRLEVGCS